MVIPHPLSGENRVGSFRKAICDTLLVADAMRDKFRNSSKGAA